MGVALTLQIPDGERCARRPQLAASGSRNYLPALVHLATELQDQPSVEGVQRDLLQGVFDLVPAERGAVLVIDPENNEIGATYGWRRKDGAAQVGCSTGGELRDSALPTILNEQESDVVRLGDALGEPVQCGEQSIFQSFCPLRSGRPDQRAEPLLSKLLARDSRHR